MRAGHVFAPARVAVQQHRRGTPVMTNRVWPTISQAVAHARRTAVAPLAWDPVNLALSRFSFGPTAASRASAAKSGLDAWYRAEIAAGRHYGGYAGNASVAKQGPLLALTPKQVRAKLKAAGNEYGWEAMNQLTRVTLGMQAFSRAQLYETLVDFFSNHLNVANHSDSVWLTRGRYDRDVIRRYALGTFTDMLIASAHHPAMLTYLNLAESTKSAINENYGRELLELHTVGRIYSENDVKNAARLLTGRTVDRDFNYRYDAARHWVGAVRVLGFTATNRHPGDGQAGGDALLRYLARHPATAKNLARKLCVHYVSDAPSAALVDAVAKAYLAHNTAIEPMVSTILRSTEFWESRGRKVRRPTENLIATIRVLGTGVADMGKALNTLHWMSSSMGHTPLDWAPPNGYPDVAAAWRSASTLLTTWEFHLGFAGDWWDGFAKRDKTALYGRTPQNSGDAINLITRRLTGQTFTAAHRAALQKFVGEPATTPMSRSRLRWLLYPLIAIVLDGPHHALH
jgi:hypothetical protein